MPLSPGDTIDRYVIEARLGAGGMGEVYRARDARLQRSVALKILHPDQSAEGGSNATGGAARMLREARAAAALEHPNVVGVYDVGEVHEPESLRGMPYLAMELIKGKSLREFVGDRKVPIRDRVRWLTDVARALGAAHANGLVHRDIKPENVMIRDDGVVKVLDFGIAKRAYGPVDPTSSTEAQILPTLSGRSAVVGTPYYMSPEQMRGEDLDGRADQFSWAVVAYELLGGVPPWRTDGDALHLVAEVLSKDPELLSSRDPAIPRHVAGVVAKAMSKARESRFASMEELIAELDAAPPTPRVDAAPALAPTERRIELESAPNAISAEIAGGEIATKRSAPPPAPVQQPAVDAQSVRRRSPLRSRGTRWGLAVLTIGTLGVAAFFGTRSANRGVSSSGSASTAASSLAACISSKACIDAHGGEPYRCRADVGCVALRSDDCTVLADDRALASDDTVWIGALFPVTGEDGASFGRANAQAVDLGRQDFAQTTSGLSGSARPFGLVTCDDTTNGKRAAEHLVDVGVPAVIGFKSGGEAVDLIPSVFLPQHVLSVIPLSASTLVTRIPQQAGARLVWRTTYNSADTARPAAALVEHLLDRRDAGGPPKRVALLRFKVSGALAFSSALFESLRFNGKSALENGSDYSEFVLEDPGEPDDAPDVKAALEGLASFHPDVVVFQGGDLLMRSVLAPLEARWNRPERPSYVSMNVLPGEAYRFIGSSTERRRRFFGLTTVSTTPENARFVMHYNETFADKITRTWSSNSSYDAFFLVAYAAYALGNEPVTGDNLARAIPRLLPPGKKIEVGPTSIFDAYTALARGENIDLEGATGHLDFDPQTGEAPVDMAILCVNVDDKGKAFDSVESGLVYDATAKKLTGAMRCP